MGRTRLLLALLTAAVIAAADPAPAPAPKTITRVHDPVVIEGAQLEALKGADLKTLALLRFESGRFEPVPFQVDEKLPGGDYAYALGDKAVKDPDPTLDGNDEVVFMADDLGGRAGGAKVPGAKSAMEIEVTDPVDQGRGWLYLAAMEQANPPRSGDDYIRFEVDPAQGRKRSYSRDKDGYGVIIGSPLQAIYPDEFRVVFPDGRIGEDILDRQKIRGVIKTKVGLDIDFNFDELAKSITTAWIDGPIRVIYRADGYFDLGYFSFSGSGHSVITYYRDAMIWPMHVELPFSLKPYIDDFQLRGYMDYNQNVTGHVVYSDVNPAPAKVILDGKTSPAEKALDYTSECGWIAGYGPMGATVNRLVFPPELKDIKRKFYLVEDLETPDPPEDDPGQIGVGYEFEGFAESDILAATYYQIYYFLPRFEPGDEKPLLNIIDRPLTVQCRALE